MAFLQSGKAEPLAGQVAELESLISCVTPGVLGALGREGMLAAMSVEAATTGAVFHAYLEQVLLPELRRTKPDAVLVMDNRDRQQFRVRAGG
jgi:hypothetical protein